MAESALTPLLYHIGFKDLYPEQLRAAHVARRQLVDNPWMGSTAMFWRKLLAENPDNLAVHLCLLEAMSYERPRFDEEAWQGFEQNFTAAISTIQAILDKKPEYPEYLILRGKVSSEHWYVVHQVEYAKSDKPLPSFEPNEPASHALAHRESDGLLLNASDCYYKASSRIRSRPDLIAALAGIINKLVKSICNADRSVGTLKTIDVLGQVLNNLYPLPPDDFDQLDNLGETFRALARGCANTEDARPFLEQALTAYRHIGLLPRKPVAKDQSAESWTMAAYNKLALLWRKEQEDDLETDWDLAGAIMEYAKLAVKIAWLESADETRQAYVDEALKAVQLYVELTPKATDNGEDQGVMYLYMELADLSPFPEKKSQYLDMAQARVERDMRMAPDAHWNWNSMLEWVECERIRHGLEKKSTAKSEPRS